MKSIRTKKSVPNISRSSSLVNNLEFTFVGGPASPRFLEWFSETAAKTSDYYNKFFTLTGDEAHY